VVDPQSSQKAYSMTQACKNPGKCYVILVEDDNILNAVLSFQLEAAGINFCSASNGYQALALVQSHRPKALILDVSLEGLSGFDVVDAIKKDPNLSALDTMHLIVHTSHDLSKEEKERLTFGRSQFLTKTMCTDDISQILSQILREESL